MPSTANHLRVIERRRPGLVPRFGAVGEGPPGRPSADDEYLRHKSDSRRPGQAGWAAATRARLMGEISGIETALALTKRVLRGADLDSVERTECA